MIVKLPIAPDRSVTPVDAQCNISEEKCSNPSKIGRGTCVVRCGSRSNGNDADVTKSDYQETERPREGM